MAAMLILTQLNSSQSHLPKPHSFHAQRVDTLNCSEAMSVLSVKKVCKTTMPLGCCIDTSGYYRSISMRLLEPVLEKNMSSLQAISALTSAKHCVTII